MKFPKIQTLQEIASIIGCEFVGDAHFPVLGMNEIHVVEPGDIVFVDHPKYYAKCLESAADCIIINAEVDYPAGKTLLIVDQPFEAYLTIVHHFRPFIQADGLIAQDAQIGEGTYIYPGVFIGHHVVIGKNCRIQPNVTILDHCTIGNNVTIQSGTVIGSDAFYYNTKKDLSVWYKKMESCGSVIIKDFVEIGASCTIDRGVTHDTVIG